MWHLHQYPLMLFRAKVRLLLAKRRATLLFRENPLEQQDEFLQMNPAGPDARDARFRT
jgi:hypothetical protein